MANATVDEINYLYNKFLGRQAEPGGIGTWTSMPYEQAARGISMSEEANAWQQAHPRYGSLGQATEEANKLFQPEIENTNLYYDTLQKKLDELQNTQLGKLKSGWAGSETLPSSGFYQQQRSDIFKGGTESGTQNERARVAQLASIGAKASGYATEAYTKGLTANQVAQQQMLAGRTSTLNQANVGQTQGLSMANILTTFAQLKSAYGFTPTEEQYNSIMRSIYGG